MLPVVSGYCIGQFSCQVTSSAEITVDSGEMAFVSLLVRNPTDDACTGSIHLQLPEGWLLICSENEEIVMEPQSSLMRIFAIRVPSDAQAGAYPIIFDVKNGKISVDRVVAIVSPKIAFELCEEDVREIYNLGDTIDFGLRCCNSGNAPMRVSLEIDVQPACDYNCEVESFTILPKEVCSVRLQVSPSYIHMNGPSKQFVLIKVMDVETEEVICRHAVSLQLGPPNVCEEDMFVRIPAYVSTIVEVDKSRVVGAFEFAGGGIIDAERQRYLDFFFRLPTSAQNVLYNLDEVLFLQIGEPGWNVVCGDTIYAISELTQRQYGRGCGISVQQEAWRASAHYSQSQYYNTYSPRGFGGCIQYIPIPELAISANYLHKKQHDIPTSNIATVEADIKYPENVYTEVEIGKNFIGDGSLNETMAYRLHARGHCFTDTWCDIERIYAGDGFFGYYQDMNFFSTTVDFPMSCQWRCNATVSDLKRNFSPCSPFSYNQGKYSPYQKQGNVNLTYVYSPNLTAILNGLVLRAEDRSEFDKFDFLQHWGGLSLFTNYCGYHFNTIMSFGQQKDYLTGKMSGLLQSYYGYLSKEITSRFNASMFYNIGNTNYYDAKVWRIGYGALLNYHYGFGSRLGAYVQRVTHYPMDADLVQFSLYFNHTFSNQHLLKISYQHFNYIKNSSLNNNALVVSYTVPFGLPVDYRRDIGSVHGCVYDVTEQCSIPEATVYCEGGNAITDFDGSFAFKGIPVGEYGLRAGVLPDHLITLEQHPQMIAVQGGKVQQVTIPVVHVCTIKGKVLFYSREDCLEMYSQDEDHLIERGGMGGIRILLESEEKEEMHTCISDAIGAFVFPKLRPGTWTLHVDPQTLPPQHRVNVNGLVMDVAPGEDKYCIFRVEPKNIVLKSLD